MERARDGVLKGSIFLITIAIASTFLATCSAPKSTQSNSQSNRSSYQNSGARPSWNEQEDGQWPMPAKNYASTRFSGLNEINSGNAQNLKLAWTFSTGVLRGHEAAPIVVNNTMYLVTPYPNIVYALDLTQPGAPLKWKYEPKQDPATIPIACCDVVNRGAAYADGKIFFNQLDAHTVALDAKTGKELWKVQQGDFKQGQTITMAPIVIKDKVITGISGGEFGVRGFVTANDVNTGKQVWRAYSTGPEAEGGFPGSEDPGKGDG